MHLVAGKCRVAVQFMHAAHITEECELTQFRNECLYLPLYMWYVYSVRVDVCILYVCV